MKEKIKCEMKEKIKCEMKEKIKYGGIEKFFNESEDGKRKLIL